jgi:hypothetical protein
VDTLAIGACTIGWVIPISCSSVIEKQCASEQWRATDNGRECRNRMRMLKEA